MNPYEANFVNVSSRLLAWVRGVLRQNRRPLLILLAASGIGAVGVSAAKAPEPILSPGLAAPAAGTAARS